MEAIGLLDTENRQAWAVWQEIGTRFVVDFGLGAWALDAAIETHGVSDRGDLLERLSIIYEVMVPPRQESQKD